MPIRSIYSPFYASLLLITCLASSALANQVVTTQLTAAQAPTGGVRSVQVSPDNSRVVYLANQEVGDRYELYSRAVAGGPITKLNPSLPMGGTVESFGITADSSRVVFVADPNRAGSYELFSVPLAGGMVTSLSGLPVDGGDVVSWQLDPAGSRVAFVADQAVDEVFELYSVAVGGGTPVHLAGPSESGGSEPPTEWLVTLDGARVAFVADHHHLQTVLVVAFRLDMHFRDERAGGVDIDHLAARGLGRDGFRNAVGRKDHRAVIGAFFELFDKHRALGAQIINHIFIVHDFVAHIDRCAPFRDGHFDNLDRPIHTGTKPTRGRKVQGQGVGLCHG